MSFLADRSPFFFSIFARKIDLCFASFFQNKKQIFNWMKRNSHSVGMWAVPGGTAIPGQPVSRAKQASAPCSLSKNQVNTKSKRIACVPGIKLRRTDTTLDLSSKEPRSDKVWGQSGRGTTLSLTQDLLVGRGKIWQAKTYFAVSRKECIWKRFSTKRHDELQLEKN